MSSKPEATSTPNVVPYVRGRKSIRNTNSDSISTQSPIKLDTDQNKSRSRSRSYELSNSSPKIIKRKRSINISESDNASSSDKEDEQDIYKNDNCQLKYKTQKHSVSSNLETWSNNIYLKVSFFATVFLVITLLYFCINYNSSNLPTKNIVSANYVDICNTQKELLHGQDFEFCLNFEISLKEIIDHEKTKTILLLYDKETENVIDEILSKITGSILCYIRDCNREAVVIEGASLNVPKYTNDYGKILTEYRDSLETNGLLIVRNLEDVPGKCAQVFHYICDEYNPIVNKAFIILTMKMEKTPYRDQNNVVRSILFQLWSDIGKDNVFDPLISRIAGTILSVKL